ncbi:Protein AAR2-like [Gracilariopsis chorda]|uniref:Protein AAR2-like n=1 Tax=Gracilariopsis chorda TaxID=448386 RepID=A0A2V3IZP4_9FLOR|nr:Protein AAR2-like [Gracilariopsis chorda]|eukprot:PXF47569.1 Protein AAR2-like [Gracilariopsis chorda]
MSEEEIQRADLGWFSQLSKEELHSYFQARADMLINPAQRGLCINARTFTGPVQSVGGLSPKRIHLITLPSALPVAPVGIFFRLHPREAITFSVNDDVFGILAKGTRTKLLQVGERGVAALSLPAEEQWERLTSYITEESLRAAGLSLDTAVVGSDYATESDQSPQFASLPRLRPKKYMSPAEVTAFHIDRGAYVTALVKSRFGGHVDRLLGEMQLAFICFRMLGCLCSLEHWTKLLKEVCNSRELNSVYDNFYQKVAKLLKAQFSFTSDEDARIVFRDELRQTLACFASGGRNVSEVRDFTKVVNKLMGWSLTGNEDEGDDSDGPVIVHI